MVHTPSPPNRQLTPSQLADAGHAPGILRDTEGLEEAAELRPLGRLSSVKRKALDDDMAGRAAEQRHMDALNRRKVANIQKLRYEDEESFVEAIKQSSGLESAFTKVGLAMIGVQLAKTGFNEVVSALGEAARKSQEYAESSFAVLKVYRELSAATGNKPTAEYGAEQMASAAEAGMTAPESAVFKTAFESRGQLAKGKTISAKDYAEYMQVSMNRAAAEQIPAQVGGEMMGAVLKHEDFNKPGKGAPAAIGRAGGVLKILNAGAGRVGALGPQLTQLLASLTSEDELEGVFRNAGEAAVATSVAAEYDPGASANLVQRTAKGLRDFTNKKKAEFFKRSQIKPTDSFLEAIAKANRVIGEEVAKGVPVDTALAKFGFTARAEARGFQTFFGARNTVLPAQLANLAESEAPGADAATRKEIDELRKTKTVRHDIALAGVAKAKYVAGIPTQEVEIEKLKTEQGMIPELDTDPSARAVMNRLRAKIAGTFTGKTGRDVQIQARTLERLQAELGTPTGIGWQGGYGAASSTGADLKIAELIKALHRNSDATEAQTKANPATPAAIPVVRPAAGPAH